MKAVGYGLWAVGRSAQRAQVLGQIRIVAPTSIWRVEFTAQTRYSQRLRAAASPFLATAYSPQPTALREGVTQ